MKTIYNLAFEIMGGLTSFYIVLSVVYTLQDGYNAFQYGRFWVILVAMLLAVWVLDDLREIK